jgi:hypothetical protein
MAFDLIRGEFVLFGGADGSTVYDETWIFRGGNWQQAMPATIPPARWGHVMAFDNLRGTVVMFGGRQGSTDLGDTWEWNGTDWTQLNPSQSPSARHDSVLAYDSTRNELVLFGGYAGGFQGDTWVFRAGNWVRLNPSYYPTARSEHVMAFDRVREVAVLFSGQDGAGRQNDTWEWDGQEWQRRRPLHAPGRREEAVMVFDEVAGQIVMFGGWDLGHYTDTWTYYTDPPASAVSYGPGCQGTAPAVPYLGTSARPWLGHSFDLILSSMPAPYAASLYIGAGQTAVPLDALGMPGCVLRTSPVANLSLAGSGGMAAITIPLPPAPFLIGAQLDNQAIVLAPGANALGILVSNGLELTFGLK